MSPIGTKEMHWPSQSIVHRLDARAKLLLTLFMIVIVFCAHNLVALGVCSIALIACYALARIPFVRALKAILPLSFIVVLMAVINLFFVQGGAIFAEWWIFRISEAGTYAALFMGWRLLLLLSTCCLLLLTTTILDISDALDSLCTPLAKRGFPTHELSMMTGIALRFFPQFITEFQIIYQAQISRGANLSLNPFKGGFQTIGAVAVPLFTSAFRHADTLANAMDARCYHGYTNRTRLSPLTFTYRDGVAALCLVVLLAGIIACNIIVL